MYMLYCTSRLVLIGEVSLITTVEFCRSWMSITLTAHANWVDAAKGIAWSGNTAAAGSAILKHATGMPEE